jgi:hypothetical protein
MDASQHLTVDGKDVEGLSIGTAVLDAIPVGPRLFALAYTDSDGDGRVSRDECGIAGSYDTGVTGANREQDWTPGSLQYTATDQDFPPIALVPGVDRWARQTSPPPKAGDCYAAVQPKQRFAPEVFEVNIGFQMPTSTASIHGVAFVDEDADDAYQQGEKTISDNVQVTSTCNGDFPPSTLAFSQELIGYKIKDLPAGDYTITRQRVGDYLPTALFEPTQASWSLTLAEGETATFNMPFAAVPFGTMTVVRIPDANGDGLPNDDVLPDGNVPACYAPAGGPDTCVSVYQARTGIALVPPRPRY